MKKKQYEKLVLDATALVTKAKLLAEQITLTTTSSSETIAAIDEKLVGIDVSIVKMKKTAAKDVGHAEFAITGATIKRLLHAIEKDLTASVENPINHDTKHINTLREALQKLINKKAELEDDGEFDLSVVDTLINQTQQILDTNSAKLQEQLKNLAATRVVVDKNKQEYSMLMLEDELEDAALSTAKLTDRVSHLKDCLARSPELAQKHKEFAPLLQAFSAFNIQAQLLSQSTAANAGAAAPAQAGVGVEAGEPGEKPAASQSPRARAGV